MQISKFLSRLGGYNTTKRRASWKATSFVAQVGVLEERLLLTVNATGWTEQQPSSDSRIIYVSSSLGNDANNGLSESSPKKTIKAAMPLVRQGMPDWVILKSGDTFAEGIVGIGKSGRSNDEPMVISSYGPGPRPVLSEMSLQYMGKNWSEGYSWNYAIISNLEFRGNYANNVSDPNLRALLFDNAMKNITIEGNLFTGYHVGVQVKLSTNPVDASGNIVFRRNVVAENGKQGLLYDNGDGLLIEENVFDHNGFGTSGPSMFNHNVYLLGVKHATLRDNIFARGSNFGTKLASDAPGGFTDFVVHNNLYFANGIGLDHSDGSSGDINTTFTHETGTINNNVFTELGVTFNDGTKQDQAGWVLNTNNVDWTANLFVHKPVFSGHSILELREHSQSFTVQDSVIYDWNIGVGKPQTDYLQTNTTYVSGYTAANNQIDLPAASYIDPTRTVGSYYTTIGGANDPVAFLTAARQLSKANWNAALTADAVNDYIRAGFARVLATPVFSTPNNTTTANPLQTVSWNTIDGADGYEVWYSNLTTGQNPAFIRSTNSNSYTPATALPIGKYQVWVRASQNNGPASPWSTPIILRVNAAPVLNSLPANGVSARPQLSWNPLPGAVKYEVWGDNLTTGATKVVSATNLTQTTFTPASDLGFSLYRFWVRGVDAKGVFSQWSLAQDYSRLNLTSVIQPVLSNGIDARPTITWAAVQGAVRYELWANNLTSGAIAVINNALIIGTSFTPVVPLSFDTYRLWVRAFDSISRATPWSNPLDVATVPTLLSPVQPTFERRPTFTWAPSAIAASYDLWINIANAVTTQTALTGTSWTPTSDLPIGDMSWWVRPRGADGVPGPWSKKAESSIGGRSAVLTAGVPGNDPGRIGVFTWKAVTGAGRYILQVDLVGVGTVVRQDNLTNTSFTTSAPLAAGQYRAWIKAINGADNITGIWSAALEFSVVSSQGATDPSANDLQLVLRQWPEILADGESNALIAETPQVAHPETVKVAVRVDAGASDRVESGSEQSAIPDFDDWQHPSPAPDSWMSEQDANLIDFVMGESRALMSVLSSSS